MKGIHHRSCFFIMENSNQNIYSALIIEMNGIEHPVEMTMNIQSMLEFLLKESIEEDNLN